MKRRDLLKATLAGATALAAPRIGRPEPRSTITFVPHADLAALDPVWTTAEVSLDVGTPVPATALPLLAASVHASKATLYVATAGVAHQTVAKVIGESGGTLFVDMKELPAGTAIVPSAPMSSGSGSSQSRRSAVHAGGSSGTSTYGTVEKASASTIPTRSPSLPMTAACIDPASPAESASTTARAFPADTGQL